MEALQFDPIKKVLLFLTLPKPKIINSDEVVIEVAYAGLCGTDLHILQGEFPCVKKPFVLGHEFSGVVRETGSAVKHVKPGDRIAVDPQSWCSTCKFCTIGKYHMCVNGGVDAATGICYDGGWGKYAKVRARQVYKLPDSLSLKQGALCEPVSCVVWGLQRVTSSLSVGADILVVGAGIIGNLWSGLLHHLGHRRVTIVEPSQERREINKKLETGFKCITPQELAHKIEAGENYDLVIDCSGNGGALEQAFSALGRGGILLLFGVAPPETQIRLSPYEIFMRELTILGTNINPFSMKKAINLMEAMGDKYLDYKKLGIEECQLKDYTNGISALKTGSIAKLMFTINPNLE